MSNISAHIDLRHQALPAVLQGISADITKLRSKVSNLAQSLFAKIQHRQMLRRFERFSDYDLQDVGFERDWDGSILPIER
jgi:hypothetical protein